VLELGRASVVGAASSTRITIIIATRVRYESSLVRQYMLIVSCRAEA